MKTKLSILSIFALTAVVFFSCDTPVALGKRLNLDPPEVIITEPGFMGGFMGKTLDIKGTASDHEEVVSITVTVERIMNEDELELDSAPEWKREWLGDRGVWQIRGETAEWEVQEGEEIFWDTPDGPRYVEWGITMDTEDAPSGEYLISARAYNNVNNSGPLAQRRVQIDKTPPIVTVVIPLLENTRGAAAQYADRFEPAYLSRLHNKKITIQYEIKDDFSIRDLKFMLVDGNRSPTDGSYTGIFYNEDGLEYVDPLGWSGRWEIPANKIKYPTNHSDESLRGQVITYGDGPFFLQLISIATDLAGNDPDVINNHGWLIYWPDADKPWAAGVANVLPPEAPVPANANPSAPDSFLVYPGYKVQGQAYDNDGLASLSFRIFKWDRLTNTPGASVALADGDNGIRINTPFDAAANPSTFFSWSFVAPDGAGDYLIEVDTKDMYGLAGDTNQFWFYVLDINVPSIHIMSGPSSETVVWAAATAPFTDSRTETLFGTKSGVGGATKDGNFTIKGWAEDGTGITKISMVWVKPTGDSANTSSIIEYKSADSSRWNQTAGTVENGNILWNFALGTASTGYKNRAAIPFAITLNLFDDLGIPASAYLKTQNFIIRAQGSAGKAVTEQISFRGDASRPTVTITNVEITRLSGGIQNCSTDFFDGVPAMSALQPGDTIVMTGIWDDDSREKWAAAHLDAHATFNDTITANITVNTDGTWTSDVITITTVPGKAKFQAIIKDMANNTATHTLNASVDTDNPLLMYILADQPDGAYREGTIDIYLQFNKGVVYDGGSPTLTIGVDGTSIGTAVLASPPIGTASNKHYFKFDIGDDAVSDTNGKPITVLSINDSGPDAWQSSGGNSAVVNAAALGAGANLGSPSTRMITVDKTPPQIASISSNSGYRTGESYFKEGATLSLVVEFNEDIVFTTSETAATALDDKTRLLLNVLNSGNPVYAINPVQSGERSLVFEYKVAAGDNTPTTPTSAFLTTSTPYLIMGVGGVISDRARGILDTDPGNELNVDSTVGTITGFTNITDHPSNAKRIVIDTEKPVPPGLSGNYDAGSPPFTYDTPRNFVLTGEADAKLYYSLDGGIEFIEYKEGAAGKVIPSDGEYALCARQIDLAGNVSDITDVHEFEIHQGEPLIRSLGGIPGTYTLTNNVIRINIGLREPVTVANSANFYLQLNVVNSTTTDAEKRAVYKEVDGNSLVFEYEVKEGDSTASWLDFSIINMGGATIAANPGGGGLTDEFTPLSGWLTAANRLSAFTHIDINTSQPSLTAMTLNPDGTVLTLTFDKPIYKGTGDITLTQADGTYLAPAVMSKADYSRWTGNGDVLAAYYKLGINGANSGGDIDNTPKYILDFDTPTNNNTLTDILKNADADKVVVQIGAGAVTKGTNTLTVNLTAGFGTQLRVKGVNYVVSLPETLVQDSLQNPLKNTTITLPLGTNTVNNPGVNEPFIRVNKARDKIVNSGTIYLPSITNPGDAETYAVAASTATGNNGFQPVTAGVKIDTQTPGAVIRYRYNEAVGTPFKGWTTNGGAQRGFKMGNHTSPSVAPPTVDSVTNPTNGQLVTGATTYTASFNLGSATDMNGYLYGITVTASVGNNMGTNIAVAHEMAARSIIAFRNVAECQNWNAGGGTPDLWIRGGDQLKGASVTPNFPLAWDVRDYAGMRFMTGGAGNDQIKFWVTWEVNVPAYFNFYKGPISGVGVDGPSAWASGKNNWAFQHQEFPLNPGNCLVFSRDTVVSQPATQLFEFFDNYNSR